MITIDFKAEPARPIRNILLVEDSSDDAFFFRRAIEKAGFNHTVTHVINGAEAIKYVSRAAPYDNVLFYPLVDVLVLDLKMPCVDGFEVLQWLQKQPIQYCAPILVLTSSELPSDRKRAAELGANEYYVKPLGFDQLMEVAKSINNRWMTTQE
jgi:CheY-like chemotaxis protein